MLVYVDSNVLLDLVYERSNVFGKNLGERASVLVDRVLSCEHFLVVSDWTVKEMQRHGVSLETVRMLFGLLGKKIKTITATNEDRQKARELDDKNYDDALHVVLALKAEADIIATRDLKHFLKYRHLIKSELPENL